MTPNTNAGQRVPCLRCGKPCIVAPTRNPSAKMAVESDGQGVCAECIVTGMLKGLTGVDGRDACKAGWFVAFTVEGLRLPHVQEQVVRVIQASGSTLPAERLDWGEIVANWELPLPKSATGGWFW